MVVAHALQVAKQGVEFYLGGEDGIEALAGGYVGQGSLDLAFVSNQRFAQKA